MSNVTETQLKWTLNTMPKSDDKQVENMSVEEMQKAMGFHKSFPQYSVTPLTSLSNLADYLGLKRLYVKDESYRFGLNAFKVLGGSYAIARYIAKELGRDVSEVPYNVLTSKELREEFGQATFFTATDGNHGRGIAWAANRLGQKCVVRMPKGTTQTRLENIAKENATVTIEDLNYDDCVRMAAKEAENTEHGIMVQDTAWEGYEEIPTWIMQGYGTLATEADEQLEADGCRPTHIFIQAGVGSLAGAVIGYFANRFKENPPIMVVVEAKAADCLYRSASKGDGSCVDVTGDMLTIMAGLACGEANTVSWDILRNHADAFVSCPDWVSANGSRIYGAPLRGDERVFSGESGSVTMGLVAALMTKPEYKDLKEALKLGKDSEVLLVSSEGDTDPDRYREIVWDGLCGTDKEPFADLLNKEDFNMDFNKIKETAKNYEADMTKFLRDIVKFPGESCDEKAHIDRIAEEMRKLDFDKVVIDPQGNVLGYMGTGEKIIGFDAHIDTVGIGNIDNWTFDPYEGYENDEEIGGRGVSDQCGGIVSAVYGAKIMKDLGLLSDKYTVLVTGTVQEEDCDGLCWQYIINEDKVRPEFVVSTEPTDGGIYRGQRGRMEIRIDVQGVSCHGSAPERGDNAIYKMADILQEVRALNENDDADDTEVKGLVKMLNEKYNPEWKEARFLGRGTVTVSEIFFTSPSRCAVADSCAVSLDRRMTAGETWESCLDEIRALPSVQKYGKDVKVSMYEYARPSYTDCVYPIECYFPTWVIPEDHKVTKALEDAYKGLYGDTRLGNAETEEMRKARPLTDKWTFSTNGVSIMGRNGIPCIGFGPGAEAQAHAPNEKTWKVDLVRCAAVYAALPTIYCK